MKTLKKLLPYIIILIVVVLIRSFIITPAVVNGDSMKDTLLDGEVVLVNKIYMKTSELKRYDIVVIKEGDEHIVKRIIGLPGEKAEYKNNELYINDKKIETNIKFEKTDDFVYEKVEEGKYFVLGDNRDVSKDSRIIGTINKNDIVGKVNIILFPFTKFGVVK